MEGISLQGAEGLGELWCIPIESDLAAIWYETKADAEISAISINRAPIKIVRQHRLLHPAATLSLALVRGNGLRDGARCELSLASTRKFSNAVVKLAPARSKNSSRVLSFITGKRQSPQQLGGWSPLVRYLAFMTNWRLRCDVVANVAGFSFATAEVPAHHFDQGRTLHAFVHRHATVAPRRITAVPLSDDVVVFIMPHPVPERAFVELGPQLIELDLRFGALSDDRRAINWLRGLPELAREKVLSVVSETAPRGAGVDALIPAVFPGEHRIELPNSSQLFVAIAAVVEGRLLVCIEAIGNIEISAIELGLANRTVVPAVWSQFRRHLSPVKGGNGSRRMRLVAAAEVDKGVGALAKVVIMTNLGRHQVMVSCHGSGARALRLFRVFLPEPSVDDGYVEKVILPVAATAKRQSPKPSLVEFGQGPARKGGVSVAVLAGNDLDALHKTLLSVDSVGVPALSIRVVLSMPEHAEAICQAMHQWARRYGLDGAVEIPLDDIGESACTGQRNIDSPDAIVAIRAGTTLSLPWRRALMRNGTSSDALLMTAPDSIPEADLKRPLDPDRIIDLPADALVGLVVSAKALHRIDRALPFQTVEGEWLGIAMALTQQGGRVHAARATSADPMPQALVRGRISERIDRILLERAYAGSRSTAISPLVAKSVPRKNAIGLAREAAVPSLDDSGATASNAKSVRAIAGRTGG